VGLKPAFPHEPLANRLARGVLGLLVLDMDRPLAHDRGLAAAAAHHVQLVAGSENDGATDELACTQRLDLPCDVPLGLAAEDIERLAIDEDAVVVGDVAEAVLRLRGARKGGARGERERQRDDDVYRLATLDHHWILLSVCFPPCGRGDAALCDLVW